MTKIKITINNTKYEFDSMEEAKKVFPNIDKDINEIYKYTDKAFIMVDEAFDMMDTAFKKFKKIMRKIL
jgi:hypothetical protein